MYLAKVTLQLIFKMFDQIKKFSVFSVSSHCQAVIAFLVISV